MPSSTLVNLNLFREFHAIDGTCVQKHVMSVVILFYFILFAFSLEAHSPQIMNPLYWVCSLGFQTTPALS